MLYKPLSLRSPGVLPLIAVHFKIILKLFFNCNFCDFVSVQSHSVGRGSCTCLGMCSSRVEVQISLTMF